MREGLFVLCVSLALGAAAPREAVADEAAPYTVVGGNAVDKTTYAGWRTWRALACERCHGAQQEGLVGPSLVESFKRLSKGDFQKTVTNGTPGTAFSRLSNSARLRFGTSDTTMSGLPAPQYSVRSLTAAEW